MKRAVLSLAVMLLAAAGARAAVTCSVTGSVAFGSFNPLPGQSADTAGTISVTCMGNINDSVSYTITINSGNGSFFARKMVSGTHNLTYNLYKDSNCTQVWGDNSSGTYAVADSFTLSSTSNTKNYIVYSRIAPGQNTASAGSYGDNLLINLIY